MEEKKSTKINLSTLICILIILLLVAVIIGMLFYYNKGKTLPSKKIVFNYGTYTIDKNTALLSEVELLTADESIKFSDDNTFIIYTGWGYTVSGTYAITDGKIVCTANKFISENTSQEVNFKIELKVNSDSEIEITNAPETYTIYTEDFINKKLTDEIKEMPLSPLINGIKLKLSK